MILAALGGGLLKPNQGGSVGRYTSPLLFSMLTDGARAVVCGSGARLPCPQHTKKKGAEADATTIIMMTVVLESVERCSGACSYSLFTRCVCGVCRTTYAEAWVHVPLDAAPGAAEAAGRVIGRANL